MATAAIGAGLSLLGPLLGGIMGQNAQDWVKGGLVDTGNTLKQLYGDNSQLAYNSLNPQRDALLSLTSRLQPWLYGDNEGNTGALASQMEALQRFGGQITPEAYQQFIQSRGGLGPGFEDQLNNLSSLQGTFNSAYGGLERILGSGGQDERLSSLFERLNDIGLGRGAALDEMNNVGSELLSQRGRTNMTMGTQDRALDALNSGGWGRVSDLLFGAGGNLAGRGQQLANREALLPIDFAASMARDNAARQSYKAAENFRRRALAKGGGPGALSSGSQNRALLEFEDFLLGNESDALQKSLTEQQALQLQQMGQGFQGAAQGLGAAGQSQSLATQLQQVLGALGIDAGQLETARLGVGGQLGQGYNQIRTNALQAANVPVQQQLANLMQASGLMGQTASANTGLYDSLLGKMLGGGQLGLQQGQSYFDTLGQNLSQQGQFINSQQSPYLQGVGALGDTGRSFLSLAGTALAGLPGLYGSAPSGSPLGGALSTMGQGMGQAIGQWVPQPQSGRLYAGADPWSTTAQQRLGGLI